ncbi:hypothetical protein FM107_05775 [Sphingobacterium sp. JB170]|nr:hypothetical protein FM107_05775 [Sphingobacterium sp. JB170]
MYNKTFKGVLLLLVFCHSIFLFGQSKRDFKVFAVSDNYNNEVKNFIKNNSALESIKILKGFQIDPYKNGEININSIRKNLAKMYPKSDASGVLCLNIENKQYQNLKNFGTNTNEYKHAIIELNKMISTVRKFRPNLKIGIYGMPFRFYYSAQNKPNMNKALDGLLRNCDYLFPSMYILFTNSEIGEQKNLEYLNDNLEVALEYGERLKKDVVPFVWYGIHTNNKKFGSQLIPKETMMKFVDHMKSYSRSGNNIKGIVWWDGQVTENATNPRLLNNEKKVLDKNSIILDYMSDFISTF